MVGIELDNVCLTFRIRRRITFKEFMLKEFGRKNEGSLHTIDALQNINLKVADGERVGIVGGNGSGKSSLLRLLAGIYCPTSGDRFVEGRISSLFELNLGFDLDSSGWKNILFRSYLQGETPWTLKDKVQGIADFSELDKFLDIPVRHYSAGMLVRLAFSIATASEPEILLVDEVLAAGDMAFREKAKRRMRSMMDKARITIVVSHDLEALPEFCDRALWLNKGVLRCDGPVNEVISAYRDFVSRPKAQAA